MALTAALDLATTTPLPTGPAGGCFQWIARRAAGTTAPDRRQALQAVMQEGQRAAAAAERERARAAALEAQLQEARSRIGVLEGQLAARAPAAPAPAQAPEPPVGLGPVTRLLDAAETKAAWLVEMRAAKRINLLAFTFDLEDVIEEMIAARVRKVEVRAIFDKRQAYGSATRRMKGALKRVAAYGVEVRTISGFELSGVYHGYVAGSGVLHAKALVTETSLIVGSCNWTTASQANREWDVQIQLNEAGQAEVKRRYDELWAEAQAFDLAEAEAQGEGSAGRRRSPSRAR